jgi:hypothetical protein
MLFCDLKYLYSVVIENRSLAENNPLNLARGDKAIKEALDFLGEKKFIETVWKILDETE